jgi:hypothetical protein
MAAYIRANDRASATMFAVGNSAARHARVVKYPVDGSVAPPSAPACICTASGDHMDSTHAVTVSPSSPVTLTIPVIRSATENGAALSIRASRGSSVSGSPIQALSPRVRRSPRRRTCPVTCR